MAGADRNVQNDICFVLITLILFYLQTTSLSVLHYMNRGLDSADRNEQNDICFFQFLSAREWQASVLLHYMKSGLAGADKNEQNDMYFFWSF